MSSRPILTPFPVILDGDMSSDIDSNVTIATNLSIISYDIFWAGTAPVGTLSVQVSNTYTINAEGSVNVTGSWRDYPGASAAVSGNTGTGYFNVSQLGSYAVRLHYAAGSGVGVLQAVVNAKVQ